MNGNKLSELADVRSQIVNTTKTRERIALLFDKDSFVEIDTFARSNGQATGVITGYGLIEGSPVYVFAQDSSVDGGAVGRVHAARIKKLYDLALKTGAPIVGLYDSIGGKLAEASDTLAAYGEMLLSVNNLSGVVPQISVVLGVCGGCAAMIAASADFVIMSEKAELFIAPSAPDTASASSAAKSGVAHIVEKDDIAALKIARNLVALLPLNNISAPPVCDFAPAATAVFEGITETVTSVADAGSVLELQKEFDQNAYTALATLGGASVGFVFAKDELTVNSASKIARFVSICDCFQIPVVTFVDCSGFCKTAADLSVRDCARLAHVYAEATTPKIAVIVGKAYGAAYIALAGRAANADYTFALPTAIISALAPETAVAFLYGDKITAENPREKVEQDYINCDASPYTLAADGSIDDIIAPEEIRPMLLSSLDMLSGKRVQRLPKKHSNIPM